MNFLKNLDEDQINLLKCTGGILLFTALAAPFVNGFGTLGFILLFNRIIFSIFWRFKNKSRFKRGKYICELHNKRIDKVFGNIFFLLNIAVFTIVYVGGAYFELDSMLVFFLCIFVTFIVSYIYQFFIKAPVGAFYASDPRATSYRRDPFEKSFTDSWPERYSIGRSDHPMNIYYDSRN